MDYQRVLCYNGLKFHRDRGSIVSKAVPVSFSGSISALVEAISTDFREEQECFE